MGVSDHVARLKHAAATGASLASIAVGILLLLPSRALALDPEAELAEFDAQLVHELEVSCNACFPGTQECSGDSSVACDDAGAIESITSCDPGQCDSLTGQCVL